MSVKVLNHVWEHSKQRGARLLVLLAIADSANDDGYCWHAVPKLARKARMSAHSFRRHTQPLAAAGELVIFDRHSDNQNVHLSNIYRIPMTDEAQALPDVRGRIKLRKAAAGTGKNGGTVTFARTPKTAQGYVQNRQEGTGKSDSTKEPSLEPKRSKDIAPTGAPQPPSFTEPSSPQLTSMPAESPAKEDTPATSDLPDGYTLVDGTLYVRADLLEDTDPITAYPCSAQDINALIAAWWDWVPKRPTKRGEIIPARQHFANTTNREYAENLVKRGVTPGDFIECLGDLRVISDHPRAYLRDQEMTFCYAAAVVEEWAAADRFENVYTADCPRIVPRRPGVTIDLGELGGLSGAALFARFAEHPDLMVELPRPYIGPHELQAEDDTDATDWSHEWTVEELEAVCPL